MGTNGIDNTTCGSETNPCATLEYSIQQSGDGSILILPGTYQISYVELNNQSVTIAGANQPPELQLIGNTSFISHIVAASKLLIHCQLHRGRKQFHSKWSGCLCVVLTQNRI